MMEQNSRRTENDLIAALDACAISARRGYDIAIDGTEALKESIHHMSEQLSNQIRTLKRSKFNDPKMLNGLIAQLSSIQSDFGVVPIQVAEEVGGLFKDTFAITLFGRTMAGKSTLMEILIRGNGASIGLGGQRTTRDVRTYRYKNLQITDVPGIAAFDGAEDERVAYEAAKKGDLVLFLVTNDAPQAEEAECLDHILRLGKPVICLINVKVDLRSPNDLNKGLFRRDMTKRFAPKRLRDLQEQFVAFGREYGSDWSGIPFIPVHLKAAFLSQQDAFQEVRDEVYELSRFPVVEKYIIHEVCARGSFYKFKTFLDAVAVPMLEMSESLLQDSVQNLKQQELLGEKGANLASWISTFEADGEKRIETFLTKLRSSLKRSVAAFAEEHYDDRKAGEAWAALLKKRNISGKAEELINQLGQECEAELREISRAICAEMRFSEQSFTDHSINMDRIVDGKRIWNWFAAVGNGGVAIALLAGWWNPAAWVPVAIMAASTLISFLFSDREEKVRDARRKLEKKLTDHIEEVIKQLRKDMTNRLQKDLIKEYVLPKQKAVDKIESSVSELSEVQRNTARMLNDKLRKINTELLKAAFDHIGRDGMMRHIGKVARIPGDTVMMDCTRGGVLPYSVQDELAALLREQVLCIEGCDDVYDVLREAIWSPDIPPKEVWERGIISPVKDVPCCVSIPQLDVSDAALRSRIRLAQQLTEMVVMN
ncbi:GTPase [uncultured Selenomonas sp.]|uniref:GTPase n=1 Tax=uncultured Selenomonas sp. TaxID=159275 RepID=UPI0028EB80FB|nr:GTPase [uncultured Selenomonas sp.]